MKLVICEGKNDLAVLNGLLGFSDLHGFTLEQCNGRSNLERYIGDLPVRPEFTRLEVESLAILIDAEENADASWQKLQNAVEATFNLHLPQPGVFLGEQLKIGGFIVSGDQRCGMIEDLCLASVSDQPGYSCLQKYFACLSKTTGRAEYHPKARFRAWMASQTEYEFHVGKAASHGFIRWDHPAFSPLREFLREAP